VAAQIGLAAGHDDGVAGAGLDGLVAAWADVTAAGLVRLDTPDIEVVLLVVGRVVGRRYSSTSSMRVPNEVLGCRKATVVPRLPVRGCSSTTRAPWAFTSSSTSSQLSTL
jgi:hypothetical protein